MKIKYAVLSEDSRILEISDDVKKIIEFGKSIENRQNGKTTRALFLALSSDRPVLFVSSTSATSRYKFEMLIKMLNSLNFEYTTDKSMVQIKPKYSGLISFVGQDFLKSRGFKPLKDHNIVYDLE